MPEGGQPPDYSGLILCGWTSQKGTGEPCNPPPALSLLSIPLGKAELGEIFKSLQIWELDWQTEFDLVISEWTAGVGDDERHISPSLIIHQAHVWHLGLSANQIGQALGSKAKHAQRNKSTSVAL